MTTPYRTTNATVYRRRTGTLAVPAAVAVLGVLMTLLGWSVAFVPPWGPVVAVTGALGFLLSLLTNPLRTERTVMLEADVRGVFGDGELLAGRDDLVHGYIQPGPTILVRFKARRGGFDVRPRNEEDGRALLRALRLDASLARVTFFAPSPSLTSATLGIGIIFLLAPVALVLAWHQLPLLIPFDFLLLLLLHYLPMRIVTGTDGVRIVWLGRGRFVPYGRITHIVENEDEVAIRDTDGAIHAIRFVEPWWFRRSRWFLQALFGRQKLALAARMKEGLRAHQERQAESEVGALLVRGGRSKEEWLASLRDLGTRDTAGYRTAKVPRDLLWQVAENPSASPEERAAAAVALRAQLDAEERARLSTLADATAAPKVRVALERAAAPAVAETAAGEEELADALVECEEEAAQERRRRA